MMCELASRAVCMSTFASPTGRRSREARGLGFLLGNRGLVLILLLLPRSMAATPSLRASSASRCLSVCSWRSGPGSSKLLHPAHARPKNKLTVDTCASFLQVGLEQPCCDYFPPVPYFPRQKTHSLNLYMKTQPGTISYVPSERDNKRRPHLV